MKKALLLFAAGLFFVGVSNAQYERPIGSEFSVGITGALPVGDFSDVSSFGLGGDLKYAYNFNESIAATVSAGYNNFFVKDELKNAGFDKNVGIVPLKAGVRFSMGGLYAEPQLGVAIGTNEGSESAFTYAGQVGVMATQNLDLSLRYEGWSKNDIKNGFVGLRVAYTMPF
ncbi:outer membrane beta-barrel protein [Arachidicoccus terrestris]|uniref:outer membrane beta-barrel protein n=1 Tax=Arachidicoccus terrestris TaxID=2875539 RepID=UPI001CC6CCE2|nr:outer membrane beta-barrel protein [Arachidicoccus terrestris]UAY55040.1 porin family protein [Arachidicoccus terrestris]